MSEEGEKEKERRLALANTDYNTKSYQKKKARKEASFVDVQEYDLSNNTASTSSLSSSLPCLLTFIKDLKKKVDLKDWKGMLSKHSLRVTQNIEFIDADEESRMWMKEKSSRVSTTIIHPSSEISRSWKIQFRDPNKDEWVTLFRVKKSTIKDARYGLFAERRYSKDDVLGVFYGMVSDKVPYTKYTAYAMHVAWPPKGTKSKGTKPKVTKDLMVDPRDGPATTKRVGQFAPAYFGIHMANDPNWGKKKDVDYSKYNFIVDTSLVAKATKEIAVGEELFLQYRGAIDSSK